MAVQNTSEMAFQNTSQVDLGSSFEKHRVVLVINCVVSLLLGIPLAVNTMEHLKGRRVNIDYEMSLICLEKFNVNVMFK